jgi:hypothetical protein
VVSFMHPSLYPQGKKYLHEINNALGHAVYLKTLSQILNLIIIIIIITIIIIIIIII